VTSGRYNQAGFFDYAFFLRPMLHPPVWTIVILGFYYETPGPSSIAKLLFLLIISSAVAGWAYVLNQISDIESDRINDKLYFLPRGIISIRSAYVLATIAFFLTVIGGFLLGKAIGILFAIGLAVGYIYSGKPINARNHPLGSVLTNGIAHGPLLFLIGYVGSGGVLWNGLIPSLPYFFAVVAVFIGTTIPDIVGDSRSRKITPGVALGVRPAIIVMTLSLAISFYLALINHDMPLAVVAGLSMPFYAVAIIKSNERWAVMSIKISILLLSIIACVEFWPYAVILIVLFAITRVYYKRRFDIIYPRLT
jgi:4-hydroxybenzoate polyprenyltransferase